MQTLTKQEFLSLIEGMSKASMAKLEPAPYCHKGEKYFPDWSAMENDKSPITEKQKELLMRHLENNHLSEYKLKE